MSDPAGAPVAGARIEVVGQRDEAALANASGVYCLPPFSERRLVRVIIAAEGYQEQLAPPIAVGPGVDARIDVTLTKKFVEHVTVTGRADSLVGISASASEGSIGMAELSARPLLRSADIMEAVPGVAMTQHSTGGHAPIILLRGYDLDHGTDFATFLEGVPLNLPSHAHAQGYTDTNFLIPELIGRIDFQKGPYAAAVGDFGTAGSANVELPETIPRPFATFEFGPNAFYHGVAAGSATHAAGRWLYAAEGSHYDGPSVVPDQFTRARGVLQFSGGDAAHGYRISAFSYGARWNATDGYPERALERGYITRFGTLDPTDGGHTQRQLVIARRQTSTDRTIVRITGYAQYYDFGLFSNLTFWTRDARLGDQIHQAERRFTSGFLGSRRLFASWSGRPVEVTVGTDVRNDVARVQLTNTYRREPADKRDDFARLIPASVYDNRVNETSVSPYLEARVRWTPRFRAVAGLRADVFHARVDSDRPENSGRVTAGLVSPKGGVVFGPWRRSELYLNAGFSFHSNHANGVVQRVDPVTGLPRYEDGTPLTPSELLVRTHGAELGVRTTIVERVQSSASLWIIDSDSELLYAPEAGFTEPERPGRRYGIEWSNFYRPRNWLAIDADAAWSIARYRVDPLGEGRHIPNAVHSVLNGGVSWLPVQRVSGTLRARYLGRRPLVSDGSASARSSLVVNGQITVGVTARLDVGADILNAFDRRYDDATYYFPTRIRDPRPGGTLEAAARADFVTHPGEPRTIRVRLRARF